MLILFTLTLSNIKIGEETVCFSMEALKIGAGENPHGFFCLPENYTFW